MKFVRLSQVAKTIDYGVTASASEAEVGPKFLRITDIQNGNVDWDDVPFCDADPKKLRSSRLAAGDIVFARTGATTGKSFLIRNCPENAVFASYLIRVRPSASVDPAFLSHFFDSREYWDQIYLKAAGAAQPGVNASKLAELEIPLPPLEEQRRIAGILDQADALRRLRTRALDRLNTLGQAIFHKMFGDVQDNPRGLPTAPLTSVATFTSGATPSKSNARYWRAGDIPWITPKDMKTYDLCTAIDKISKDALNETSLKSIPAGTPLIVVRGMILAHTVPMGITRVTATINQDMKAINFAADILPEFGLFCLLSQHSALLKKVDTAAHGTKRFDMDRLGETKMLVPCLSDQEDFLKALNISRLAYANNVAAQKKEAALFTSLQHRAFRGEL